MEDYNIFCIIAEGEIPFLVKNPFSVKIPSNATVDELKKKIKEERKPKLDHIAADELMLYRVDIKLDIQTTQSSMNELVEQTIRGLDGDPLNPVFELSDYYTSTPTKKTIHLIARLSAIAQQSQTGLQCSKKEEEGALDVLAPLPGEARQNETSTQLLNRWSTPVPALTVSDLWIHLSKPLADDEKITITQKQFNGLLKSSTLENRHSELTTTDLAILFRVSSDDICNDELVDTFAYPIRRNPPQSGTEDSFHATWDHNISEILRMILSDTKFIRNSNRGTSMALKRPDYGFIIKKHCVFRGEEKGTETSGDPKRELVEKLRYTYHPLKYILGYHATGAEVNLVAITEPPSETKHLFEHNLGIAKERVANLVHMIRLAGIISWMGGLLGHRDFSEFAVIDRPDGLTRITLGTDVIKKEFQHEDGSTRVLKLVEIYKILKEKQVPCVDALQHHSVRPAYVLLSPMGQDGFPSSGSEAYDAVVCVLKALTAMHSLPTPVYHRDIRPTNILKSLDGRGWFLIDFTDATTAPTTAVMHMKEHEHSPNVRQDNHGAEVDMWGVAYYLGQLSLHSRVEDPDAISEMAQRWQKDEGLTAETALVEVMMHQRLFFAPAKA